MEAKLNIRLDERTDRELSALVEHFAAKPESLGKVTASDVTRLAIHQLHKRTLERAVRAA